MRKLLIVAVSLTAVISGEAVAAAKYNSSSTITYSGITYKYSSSSTCTDGKAALRLYRTWWCPVSTTSTTTASTSGTNSTSGTSTTTSPTSTASSTWTRVAEEWQNFSLSGTQTVRYGAGSSWVQKQLSGTQLCISDTFGGDPAVGVLKVCEVSATTTAATTSATTTTSTTATTSTISTTTASITTDSGTSGTSDSTSTSSSTELTSTSSGSTSTVSTGTTTTVAASYNANISWTIPTTRADGTPLSLSELAGYEVYYTNDSGSVSVSVPVTGGSTASTVLSNLSSGNYYFSISAIDTSGLKSALSTVALVTFP